MGSHEAISDLVGKENVYIVSRGNQAIKQFDASCFNGEYVTGDISQDYLRHIEDLRSDHVKAKKGQEDGEVIDLHNAV